MPSRKYCCVYGCLNCRRNKNMSFFSLPVNPVRRKKWLQVIGREDLLQKEINYKSHEVCALHFPLSMFKIKKYLTSDAIPTLHLPQTEENKEKATDDDETESNNDEKPNAEENKPQEMDKTTQTHSSFVQSAVTVPSKRTFGTQTEGLSVSEREKKLFHMLRQSEKKRRKLEMELEELRKSKKSEESSDSSDDDEDYDD